MLVADSRGGESQRGDTRRAQALPALKTAFDAARTESPSRTENKPRYLRCNLLTTTRKEVREKLAAEGVDVTVPDFMAEVVATMSHIARDNPHVNQRSGVSVRLSISNYETLVASAVRRTLRTGGTKAVPRVADLTDLDRYGEANAYWDGRDARGFSKLWALQPAIAAWRSPE